MTPLGMMRALAGGVCALLLISACSSEEEPNVELVRRLVGEARRRQEENETKQLVRATLPLRIDSYRREFRHLPPMTTKELRAADQGWKEIQSDGTTNESIEVLLVALSRPGLSLPISKVDLPCEEPFGNTDVDYFNLTPPGMDSGRALEILDAWGNPVVYFNRDGYGSSVMVVNANGREVMVRAVKRPDGTYHRATKYQVISLGRNGVQDQPGPENYDDITNFELGPK
jgi:hypothetical protein